MIRLKYRGEVYRLYKGFYVSGGTVSIAAEIEGPGGKTVQITRNLSEMSYGLGPNQAFLNTPKLGFGIISALNEIHAGSDTGFAVFDNHGNEIPIYEFKESFLKKL